MTVEINKTAPSIVLCPEPLRQAINDDPLITTFCEDVTVDSEVDLSIYFTTAISGPEDAQLDIIVATFTCPPGTGATPPAPGQVDEDAGIIIKNDGVPLIPDVTSINFEGSVAAVDGGNSDSTILVGTIEAKNTTLSTINTDIPVYITGVDPITNEIFIAPADANDPAKMPALGVTTAGISPSGSGFVTIVGEIRSVDTNLWTVGTNLYVAAGGGLTNVKPTGDNNLIQKIAQVSRQDSVEGRVVVFGAGRANDVPNITENYIWVGNSLDVATPSLLELGLLSNVDISGPVADNEVLAYNVGTGTWVNQNPQETDDNITVSVLAGNTETIDAVDTGTIRAIKWFVNITDTTTNQVVGLEIYATHRAGVNPTHNVSAVLGDIDNISHSISVTMVGTDLTFELGNNEPTNTLIVDATRIPVYV